MFEDCSKINRKRFRWRKLDRKTPNYGRWISQFLITITLLLFCETTQISAVDLTFNVSENLPPRTEVGIIEGGKIGFTLFEETPGVRDAFNISLIQNFGKIETIVALDRELISQYSLRLFHGSGNLYQITVNILDENDNPPTFDPDTITIELSELSNVGQAISIISAADEDAPPYNVQGYRLGEPSDYFGVNTTLLQDGSTRRAQLVVLQKLDRETTSRHTVIVEAYDGGNPTAKTGRLTVTVSVTDSNDNPPVFTEPTYSANVSENAGPGSDVITVKATDSDAGVNGDVTYSIDRRKSDPEDLFQINTGTGAIYVNKKLDSESATEHRLTVLAMDGGVQPQFGSAIVIVKVLDVNDNKPTISVIFLGSNEGRVSEGAAIGDYIARVSVSDPDVGDIEKFNVTLTGGDGKFGLKTENNIVYLVRVKEKLNREETSSYDIMLTATDFGSPPKSATASFTIEVEDINDNPPRFSEDVYEVPIGEDSYPGTFVIHLDATDLDLGVNSQFEYSLLPSEQSDWFDLSPQSGLITTATYLDHETNPAPRLTVVATDFGTPRLSSSTTVVVQIGNANDSVPQFEALSYRKTVLEDIDVLECFLQVRATDPDFPDLPGQIAYSYAESSDHPTEIFLDPSTGYLCIAKELDRETKSAYTLRIKATDKAGQYSFVQVVIEILDVNDNRPEFHPVTYVANVAAATSVAGNPVTRVTATDEDDASENGSGFGIITYEILTGNDRKLFSLDTKTGEISVAKPLAAYGDTTVELHIRATDGGGKSSDHDATATISILNDTIASIGGPVFAKKVYTFNVPEDASVKKKIDTVSATASGGGQINYYIRDDPPISDWFSIDTTSGDVTVASPLDREIFSTVTLQVMASAGSPPIYGFTNVVITLDDVNDNSPVFDFRSSEARLPEGSVEILTIPYNLPTRTKIYTLKASDADEGQNAVIRYSLRDDAGYFSVDSASGIISVKTRIPHQNRNYSIVVEASDYGTPPKSVTVTMLIQALQPDGSCPSFANDIYSISVSEDMKLAKSFEMVSASSTSTISYRLLPNVDSYGFGVYPGGSLYLTSRLDRELKDRYQLELIAEGVKTIQFSTPCVAMTIVDVTVNDVNDNLPYFDPDATRFTIEENSSKGAIVGAVLATDNDIGKNSDLRYSFANENPYFEINSVTGLITTTKILDRESVSSHLLLVQAQDTSDTPLISQVSVRVFVEDDNDNKPTFLYNLSPVLAVVTENHGTGTFVANLQAIDKDIGFNGEIKYSISSGQNSRFEIDSTNGRVTTKKQLSAGSTYSLVIRAEDEGASVLSSDIGLEVKVVRDSENPAEFADRSYVFFAESDAEAGAVLGRFETTATPTRVARDVEDTSVTLENFYISEGNENDDFYVHRKTGELFMTQELNFEIRPQYRLMVTAENSLDQADLYTFEAQVNVDDANDFSPAFSSALYSITVQENAPMNTKVWKFSVTDRDVGINGEVTFSIENQTSSSGRLPTSSKPFRIDPSTGELFTNSDNIDRETTPEYLLVIKATDGSLTDQKSTTVSAIVTVQDMNDNRPRFVSRDNIQLLEDEPVGFPVIHLVAEDSDFGANSHVTYTINQQWNNNNNNNEESFQLNPTTGLITLIKKLDFETTSTYYLNVSATDSAALDPLSTNQLLIIEILDVNDEAPEFPQSTYFAAIDENEDSGTLVTRVTATDGDSGVNGEVTYELFDKTQSFSIDSKTGVIVTAKRLDRETKDSYTLTVYAHDGASPSLYTWCEIEVTVQDKNDNSPEFATGVDTQYTSSGMPILATIEIPEYQPGPAVIYTVLATDLDAGENGRIAYSIAEGNTGNSFTIDSTGKLSTSRRLDREETSSYRLKLVASDNGTERRSSEAVIDVIVLDWNDNDPMFTEAFYAGEISEGLPAGQFVLTVRANDADEGLNAEVTYSIDPGGQGDSANRPEGLFAIHPQTGVITTMATLDREKKSSHQFVVQAIDSAPYGPRKTSVTVNVDVTDVNDNYPVFTETLVVKNISTNTASGSDIVTLSAQDKDSGDNGTVFYRISGGRTEPYGSWESVFHIDSNGQITTTATLNGVHTYYLNVTASDNGSPPNTAEAVVIVNIVPFDIPNFSSIQFQKPKYSVELSEGAERGDRVTQVQASLYEDGVFVSDAEFVNILYDFASGNEEETFAISHDGVVTVKDPSELDYETLPHIRLIVSATAIPTNGDGPMYAYSTVPISLTDENDNEPRFAQDRYVTEVWEEQNGGTYVLQVSASDIDSMQNGEVRYYIDSGDEDQAFKIDDITGIVTTHLKLDREIHQEYKLTLYAYDLGTPRRSGSCTLKVTVVDNNDNPPTLNVPAPGSLSVSESVDIGRLIAKVTANDPDLDKKEYKFADDNDTQNEYFTIDRQHGSIHLAKSLDYEKMHRATMKVQATDGLHVDEKEIVLYIEDDNDNAPVFDKQSYQAMLDELSPVNTSVIQVHADDADSNENGYVTYSLIDILPNKPAFFVDKFTGTIYTNLSEAFNPQSSIYNLIIMAEDHGTPSLNCSVSVRIQMKDINNHVPVFSSDEYEASVSEVAERNTHVINVTATDADFSKDNRHVYYEITSGSLGGAFKINTFTGLDGENTVGEICVASDLDRENISSYSLTVTAFDHGTPVKSSETTVTVTIDDVNDNQPFFNQSLYSASISEDANNKEPVVMVFASDPDSSSSLIFKITAGNDNGAFELGECDPSSAGCALISANNLDYEEKSAYNLTIQVWDGRDTATSKSSIVPVKIQVLDVNEHAPYFSYYNGYKQVSESFGANQTVFWVPGKDRDGGIYGKLYYSVLNGNSTGENCLPANRMFYVINKSGEVRLNYPFDYEKCQKYTFRVRAENEAGGDPRLARSQPPMSFPIEIEVTSEDEFPPIFTSGSDRPIKLTVPYSAKVGYVVGQVNATDKDVGPDGRITYELDDGQEFVIDPSTGVITLSRKLDSTNNRVLTVTATSGARSAQTLVSIEIQGAPAIALEAQILAIVFGVIAGIAVVIVLILCVKHRRNKKSRRPAADGAIDRTGAEGDFYDPTSPHGDKNGIPVATPRNRNGKANSKKISSEHQIQRKGSGHASLNNGVVRNSMSTNGNLHSVEAGNRSKSNSGGKSSVVSNGHVVKLSPAIQKSQITKLVIRNSLSSGRGSGIDEDTDLDLDKEVDFINSSPDATNSNGTNSPPKAKIRTKIVGQGRHKAQFPDSGIQKDIDCGSEISDGPNNIKSPSVESIHVFGEEGAGEEPLSIQDIEEDLETEIQNGLKENYILSSKMAEDNPTNFKQELSSQYKSPLGTESNKSSTAHSKRGGESVGNDSGYSRRGRLQNWAPEFQPLADVFSEIAKLKDRENAVRAGNHHNTFIMKDLSVPRTSGNAVDSTGPPPLITSVAEQRNDLVAPVPLGYTVNRVPVRRNVGANLVGLYPTSNPQYVRTNNNNLPPSAYLPSLYSNAMIRPTGVPRSSNSHNSGPPRPQVAFNLPHGNMGHGASSINSSQQGLSVSSLPRTPLSHESSFTSPGMSPNLTPSLSPLATRSPSVSTVGESVNQMDYDSDNGRRDGHPLSRSDPNLASYRKERMVHV